MGMLRVPLVIFFLATAWAQELSRQELGPALAADDECAADGGEACGVGLLQARASKAEQPSTTAEVIEEGGEQLLQHNATANTTFNASQPPCLGIQEPCWIDIDCCSSRCHWRNRRCASAPALSEARAPEVVKTEQPSTTAEVTGEGGEQLLQYDATANATVNASQPACRGINEACWIDNDCCSARCSRTRRCRPVR